MENTLLLWSRVLSRDTGLAEPREDRGSEGCTAKSSDGVGERRDLHHSRNWPALKLATHDSVTFEDYQKGFCFPNNTTIIKGWGKLGNWYGKHHVRGHVC